MISPYIQGHEAIERENYVSDSFQLFILHMASAVGQQVWHQFLVY